MRRTLAQHPFAPRAQTFAGGLTFDVPIRLQGSLNAREHWAQRARRVKAERNCVACFAPLPMVWRQLRAEGERFRVTLVRVAKRKVDSDNLQGRLKAVRDEVARLLGIDDRDERVAWDYAQEVAKHHSVRITVEVRP